MVKSSFIVNSQFSFYIIMLLIYSINGSGFFQEAIQSLSFELCMYLKKLLWSSKFGMLLIVTLNNLEWFNSHFHEIVTSYLRLLVVLANDVYLYRLRLE